MVTKYEKANRGKLLTAIIAMVMVFAGAATVLSDGTDAAAKPTEIGGGIIPSEDGTYVVQKYTSGEVIVVNDFTIPNNTALVIDGAKFTVNSNAKITIEAGGQLVFNGKSVVKINGDIISKGTNTDGTEDEPDNGYVGAIVNNVKTAEGSGIVLNGSILMEKGAEFISGSVNQVGSSTDPTASTATGGDIIVNNGGSITLTNKSGNVSMMADQEIKLSQGAVFKMNGRADNVTVSATSDSTYYTAGSITINETERDYEGVKEISNITFTVTSKSTSALIDNKNGSAEKDTQITLRQFIVNIDGTIDGGDVVSVGVGKSVYTGNQEDLFTGDVTYYNVTSDGIADTDKAIVPMASVTGNLVVTDATYDGASSSFNVEGYLDVSGNVVAQYKVGKTEADNKQSTITAEDGSVIYITGEVKLHINSIDDVEGAFFNVDGGRMTIVGADIEDLQDKGALPKSGAYTVTDDSGIDTTYFCDFTVAVSEAAAAEAEDVYAFAYNSETGTENAKQAIDARATVIGSDLVIPDGITLNISNAFVIAEGVTLTLGDKEVEEGYAMVIYVDGTVVDANEAMADYDGTDKFRYEVKKVTETETSDIATYTTLKNAIRGSNPGDKIQLNGKITMTSDITIPEGVTVITDADSDKVAIEITPGVTLTVNGRLDVGKDSTIDLISKDNKVGSIVVNGIIAGADINTFTDGVVESGQSAKGLVTVPGAYFSGQIGEDKEGTFYVTSVAVAAENSESISTNVTINGKVSAGNVEFIAGENNEGMKVIINTGAVVTAGTITLNGVDIEINGTFTGTVSIDVTAGVSTVEFKKASGVVVSVVPTDDGETVTKTMEISGNLMGAATISSGTVYVSYNDLTVKYTAEDKSSGVAEDKAVLTVASGATLCVPEDATLTINANKAAKAYAGLVIDGTLAIDGGELVVSAKDGSATTNDAQVDVNGTMTVAKENQSFEGIVNVTGTLSVVSEGDDACTVSVSKMYVGDAKGASGKITGDFAFEDDGFIIAYPAADVSGAAIAEDTDGESTAVMTEFFINGDLYMTSYAKEGTAFNVIVPGSVSIVGFEDIENTEWSSTEDMKTPITPTNDIDGISTAYAEADPLDATVKFSVGSQISLWIDGTKVQSNMSSDKYIVGEHTVTATVNPGYTGDVTITFNGQTITDGKFVITPDMAGKEFVLSALGNITVDTGSTGGDNNGMGLVEILLIVLVVMVVILAIVVILRMMRS